MKYSIPEISWHNRDPVLSVDFQPSVSNNEPFRLATGGTDSHVVIWHLEKTDNGTINLETAADLTRHQKAVNVVRWSPSGEYLASGDDESIIFIWKKADKEPATVDGDEQYKETWVIHKTLRGHMEDVLDISWSPCSKFLASGSVDNKLIIWDMSKARYSTVLTDHKGFVQGVAWDPQGLYIVSSSSDRVFRAFDIASKKVLSRSSKCALPLPPALGVGEGVRVRLYHDDTLQTFYRRLAFSPDGSLVAVPAGTLEPEQGKLNTKPPNVVYIYTRYNFKVPAVVIPCGENAAVCCRWRTGRLSRRENGPVRGQTGAGPGLPHTDRYLLAVATRRTILLYDTQQTTPVALISNIHYTRLTDLSWSPDGLTLIASSTDGFCSLITFGPGELGDPVPEKPVLENTSEERPAIANANNSKTENLKSTPKSSPKPKEKPKSVPTTPLDAFIRKVPKKKSPKSDKIPVKADVIEEVAMPSWSDNSQTDVIRPDADQGDSQDLKLFYEDTATTDDKNRADVQMVDLTDSNSNQMDTTETPEVAPESAEGEFLKRAKVLDIGPPPVETVPSPKPPRRVNFVTLSSPKNSKKKLPIG